MPTAKVTIKKKPDPKKKAPYEDPKKYGGQSKESQDRQLKQNRRTSAKGYTHHKDVPEEVVNSAKSQKEADSKAAEYVRNRAQYPNDPKKWRGFGGAKNK